LINLILEKLSHGGHLGDVRNSLVRCCSFFHKMERTVLSDILFSEKVFSRLHQVVFHRLCKCFNPWYRIRLVRYMRKNLSRVNFAKSLCVDTNNELTLSEKSDVQ